MPCGAAHLSPSHSDPRSGARKCRRTPSFEICSFSTPAFAPLVERLGASPTGYTVDLSDVVLMNSSGLRALADLVLLARQSKTSLTFVGKADVPWHSKTVASLKPLYARLAVRLS